MRKALIISGCLLALAALAATQSQYFSGSITVAGVVQDANGVQYIRDAPNDGGKYLRVFAHWTNAAGTFALVGHTHDAADTISGVFAPSRLGTGSGSSNTFLAGDGHFRTPPAPTPPTNGIPEAPIDGLLYGRENAGWVNLDGRYSLLSHTHSISGVSGLLDALNARSLIGHVHDWSAISSPPDFSLNGHTHAASSITSGIFDPARLGTGTPTTSTYLRGNGSGGTEFATLPTTPAPTNGIPDAPNDGVAYVRKSLAWVGLDIDDVAGVTGFGVSLVGAVDDVDALSVLGLLSGAGSTTIDAPARYSVRAHSGGSPSTRHRLNVIGGTGISVSLSDDAGNDESDITVSLGSHTHPWSDITGEPSFVETSRTISTANSLTGGGDLSANRTLSLVGDSASPGNSRYYGTDSGGTRGFHALPTTTCDVPWAVAAFFDPGSPGTPSTCTLVAGSSSGVHGVYRAEDGLYRVDLLSAQPAGAYKRAVFAHITTGYSSYAVGILSNATWRTTGTNVFVYVSQGGTTANFETTHPVMLRIYNH